MGRITETGPLEIAAGEERVRLDGFEADILGAGDEPAGAEVLVYFDRPAQATLHVYAREIADGALTCALGARRAMVRMEIGFMARVLAEALSGGVELPGDSARALRSALADRQEG